MAIAAPTVVWTPLPPDFVNVSVAAVDRTVLVGGGGQHVRSGPPVPPAVLELEIDPPGIAVVRHFWSLPAPLPENANIAPIPFEQHGPARVGARRIDDRAVSTVMVSFAADFPGSRGGWFHPLGTDVFEYIGSASIESDIDANESMSLGSGVLATSESEAPEFFVVERADVPADVTWPGGMTTHTHWRHRTVPLPRGLVTSEVVVSPSGRWAALRGADEARTRDGVLIYERGPSGWTLGLRLDHPGFRVVHVALTDAWLVVVESTKDTARLRWRTAVAGPDRYLEVGPEPGSVDVLGDRALITQGTRALVVDLARGVVTHDVQRGGEAELGVGKLVPDFAVFAVPGKIGVAPL